MKEFKVVTRVECQVIIQEYDDYFHCLMATDMMPNQLTIQACESALNDQFPDKLVEYSTCSGLHHIFKKIN